MSNDPTFDEQGRAATGQYYSSGGQNNSTGREPFEESDPNYRAPTSDSQYSGKDYGVGHHAGSHGADTRKYEGDGGVYGGGVGGSKGPSALDEVKDYTGKGAGDEFSSSRVGDFGLSRGGNKYSSASGGNKDYSSGQTGDNYVSGQTSDKYTSGQTGDNYSSGQTGGNFSDQTGDNYSSSRGANDYSTSGQGVGNTFSSSTQGSSGYTSGGGAVADSVTGQVHFAGSGGNSGVGEFRQEIGSEQETGRGLTGSNNFSSSGTGAGFDSSNIGSKDTYGSNTAASEYANATEGVTGSRGTGDDDLTTGKTDRYDNLANTKDAEDRSAGYGEDRGDGNRGVSGYEGSSTSGPQTGGAPGTDRFDSAGTGDAEYGHSAGDKSIDNQNITRTGRDFTGGAVATGGAYTNPYQKTGLTGRETTSTGVPDQHGEPTQKTGLLQKVKNALGGHNNADNATTGGNTTN